MSREEDLIRSTTHAIASSVREVPPLRLAPTADEVGAPARTPRRVFGGSGRHHRWWAWGAPLTAAAVVVALAIALVIVKDIPNEGGAPSKAATSTAGPDGTPRYYVALRETKSSLLPQNERKGIFHTDIIVGDSLTGKTLATFASPANTVFQSVSSAADDRTFVVFAVTSSTGSFMQMKGVTLTGNWYAVHLAPGTAHPARLSRLPIKPASWTSSGDVYTNPPPGQIIAMALSESGQELALADIPDIPAAHKHPQNWQEVKVFSVATGRLLRDWIENDPNARLTTVLGGTFAGVPTGTPVLTWIDGDQALALSTFLDRGGKPTGTVRSLNVSGPTSGNLMTASTVIWSGTLPWNQSGACHNMNNWPPSISANGKTITCVGIDMPEATQGHLDFETYPLAAGTAGDSKPTVVYRATIPPEKQTGGISAGILWVSPSADTLIIQWVPGGTLNVITAAKSAYFGVISHGKFIPLQIPKSLATETVQDITF